jgi:monofunctional biosynthetic peptidoglycan transglycosylase
MSAVPTPGRSRRLVWGALALLLLPLAGAAALWFSLPDPAAWARTNPTTTALIEQRRAEAAAAGRRFLPAMRWVPLERISGRLVEAVVASEDATFFDHRGFDWEALREAARVNLASRRYARGASTITQQLAKNLALGTEKSLLRKGREALLTFRLERQLEKRRILALYLNVIEWGDGVFGAEAGAQRHFGTGAASLTTAQAVLLAAMLPAPRRAALSPAPAWLAWRSRGLLDRLRDERVIPPAEHASARAELEGYLGRGPVPPEGAAGAEPPPEPPPDDVTAPERPPEPDAATTPVLEPAPPVAPPPPVEPPADGDPSAAAAAPAPAAGGGPVPSTRTEPPAEGAPLPTRALP